MTTLGVVPVGEDEKTKRGRTLHAAFWTVSAFGGAQVLRLASNVLLARLLFPEAFGLTALVGVILSGLQMFSDIGLVPCLVRSTRGEEQVFRSTAWTLGVLRGLLVWGIATVIAIPVGKFYDPRLTPLLPVAGTTALVAALGSSSVAVLGRHMRLRGVTTLELGSTVVGLSVTCISAWIHPSVWAMIVGSLVGAVFKSAGSWMLVEGYRDRFILEREAVKEIVGFGRWIVLSTIITFIALQADRLLLGKLLTIEQVGIYSIALGLSVTIRDLVGRLAWSVQYPVLAQAIRTGSSDLLPVLTRTRASLILLAQWMLLAVALGAQGFFVLLYDQRYLGAIELTRWLSVGTFIWILSSTADRALLAFGDSRSMAAANFARAATLIPACMIGFYWYNMRGFVGGLMLSMAAGHMTLVWKLGRHGINIAGGDLLRFAGFVLMLAAPLVMAERIVQLGTVRGVDIGQAVCGALILAPLGVVTAMRVHLFVRRSS